MATVSKPRYTLEEYIALEERSQERHEFYRGEIFAMVGTSPAHNRIEGNLYYQLRSFLMGKKCEPHLSSQRFAVRSADLHTYPDVSIVCGKPEFDAIDRIALVNPTVLIEILSPSTEKYDRGKKFELYRQLTSLKEYILVAQDEPHVESFLRQDDGSWRMTEVRGLESALMVASIDCRIELRAIYENVDFLPAGQGSDEGLGHVRPHER